MMAQKKGIKKLSVILVVAMLLTLIPATLGFAQTADTAKVEAFVARLYQAALDRAPDASGKAFWTNQLATRRQTAAQAIQWILIESREFQNRNLTDSVFLDTVYQAFFNRAADAPGKAFWMGKLEEGYSRRWVMQQMVGALSGEFQKRAAEAGITPGKVTGVTSVDVAFKAMSAVPTNNRTVVVTFNKDVGAAAAIQFNVFEKGNQFALNFVTGVAVSGNRVTISLLNALADDKDFVVRSNAVPAKDGTLTRARDLEFKYGKQTAVSIAFTATQVVPGSTLGLIIRDAAGNNITNNFAPGDLEFTTSNASVLGANRVANSVGFVVASAKIRNTNIETGNVIIEVVATLQTLTSVGRWTIGTDLAKPATSVFMRDITAPKAILTEALDQAGNVIAAPEWIRFRSMTPSVAIVDENSGTVFPVSVGNATVMITARFGGREVSRLVTVQVRANPVASSIRFSAPSISIVRGSGISRSVRVEVIDQYGNPIDTAGAEIAYRVSRAGVSTLPASADVDVNVPLTNGAATLEFIPTNNDPATAVVTVRSGDVTNTFTVSLVNPGAFVGYSAVAADTTLEHAYTGDRRRGPTSTAIEVYRRDVNGNFISRVVHGTDGYTLNFVSSNTARLTVGATTGVVTPVVTPVSLGSANVTVQVGTTTIAVIGFNVVDSAPRLTSVSQNFNAISIAAGANLVERLFGTGPDGGVFVGYNQYGEKTRIVHPANVPTVVSSNIAVVSNALVPGTAGTATIAMVIAGRVVTIVVNVTAVP